MVNSRIAQVLALQTSSAIIANTSPNFGERGWRYHVFKLHRVTNTCIGMLACRGSKNVAYISVDAGLGAIYTCIVAAVSRCAGNHLFLHHHSFAYIERRAPFIALLNRCAGSAACNIFLNETMRVQYRRNYRRFGSDLIVGNAWSIPAEMPAHSPRQVAEGPCLTIGHMSNLSREKGLFEFIELARRCRDLGVRVRAVLAGPCNDRDGREAIARAGAALGASFEYRGPVSGESKRQFFRDVDVFVFPTNYRFEAQPLVLLEALSFGCAVITKPRGCIAEDLGGHECVAIIASPDFVAEAFEWLRAVDQSRETLAAISAEARRLFAYLKHNADRQFGELLERLVCAGR